MGDNRFTFHAAPFLAALLVFVLLSAASAAPPRTALYTVKLTRVSPPRVAVTADLPSDGQALGMDRTRPGNTKELNDLGWPALVSNLRVRDEADHTLALTGAGPGGWKLPEKHTGRLKIEYEVDYAYLAAQGWPAPLESGMTDPEHIVLVARSLFLTTAATERATVRFDLPDGWSAVTPWQGRGRGMFDVPNVPELTENMLVLTKSAPDTVSSGGFHLSAVVMGHWLPAWGEVRSVLQRVVPELVRMSGARAQGDYLVVLLPLVDSGGESYRGSFAVVTDTPPSATTRADWARLIAHEIFHYWNGWRLQGADYASTQWFQEGFTEYAANYALAVSHLETPEQFTARMTDHVRKYQRLETTLENIGTHKGPPLYSAGTLVAFTWDILIRHATGNKRTLADFFRALWKQTDNGKKPYAWADIRAALIATAPYDWEGYYQSHIRGHDPLPLGDVLPLAGLRLEQDAAGNSKISVDPAASPEARRLWGNLTATN